jgi:acetyl-CoA carboxylase biotin carboxyl carrier protein
LTREAEPRIPENKIMAIQQILSPLPGTFYRSPAPDKPHFKNEGDPVAKGDVIGLVEVMKMFCEVKSEFAGKAVRFIVGNEDPVTAGQPLVDVDV